MVKSYGVSDITTSKSVTEHTLFMIGSTSKAFTAAAISLLVDDNIKFPNIHWNTPVHGIIPTDFVLNDSWATSQMTIIDILSHRSGFPRHDRVWLANITLQEAVQSIRHLPLTASPRTEFQYSNLMYSVAAHIIETVTNQSFQSFLRDNIWLPQDMTETYLYLSDAKDAHQDISQGYFEDLNGKVISSDQVSIDILRGAGNILSSVSDYAKWISTLLNCGPPLSPGTYGMLFGAQFVAERNPTEPFQTPTLYGLGWQIQVYKGETIISHGGSQIGYGASVVLLPERNFGLVILGNNMNGTSAAADILAYHIIDEELKIPLEQRADAAMNTTHLSKHLLSEIYPKLPSPPLSNPLDLSAFEGYYTHPAYPDLRISTDCISNSKAYEVLNRTTPDLCILHTRPNDYSKDMEWGLFHVYGTYWLQIVLWSGGLSAARIEFSIGSDGLVSRLGIEIEPAMAQKGEKIWWTHISP
ncbi:Beta-lactamase-like protein [Penicillium angulare]|uniref:Beta-lactamase-like protein n=1 Tax=Penicillium angulare TaxID=116970 RepID=UPI00254196BE|nr:Beta-lactamase-like protein [Penicillium angulare]KAJ5280904.1 Beta-lactamase-like protein [Penicillium angulare]